jgi:hypothetical protein
MVKQVVALVVALIVSFATAAIGALLMTFATALTFALVSRNPGVF